MPAMTEIELADAIAQRRFGALTLDTSIFDQFGCNLDYRALQALGPVAGQHAIRVVFSDVVAGEVQAHIQRDATEKAEKLSGALNQYRKAWRRPEKLSELALPVDLDADPTELAHEEWEAFVDDLSAEVIGSEGLVSVGELVQRYFALEAPFGAKEAKKSEFPDAIALLALEAWATREKLLVLVISRDGDWSTFCASAQHLVCTSKLEQALGHFNRAAQAVADRAVAMLKEGQAPDLKHEIELEIESWLEQADFEIEAHSDFYYDAEPESAVLQTWELISDPQVLSIEGEEVTFSVELSCLINFTANFALSVRDGIDRDYVRLNSQTAEREEKHKVSLTITVERTFDPEPSAIEVEANRRSLHVYFGNVELDWGYEE